MSGLDAAVRFVSAAKIRAAQVDDHRDPDDLWLDDDRVEEWSEGSS